MAHSSDSTKTIIDAISSSRCSTSTISSLQQLLLGTNNEPVQCKGKENVRSRKPAVLVASQPSKLKVGVQSRTKPTTNGTAAAKSTPLEILSLQERLALATDAINTTLKSLSQALKSKNAKTSSPLKSSDAPHAEPTTRKAISRTPTNNSQRALKPRSPNGKRKPALVDDSADSGPGEAISATAECSRIAFAYLRAHQKASSDTSPDFQLENGMLALIGKCLGHGLDAMALKELRILKARLDGYLGSRPKGAKSKEDKSSAKEEQEKATIAELLIFESLPSNDLIVPVVIGHQLAVLRLMAYQKNPRSIEAAIDALQLSTPSSPINILVAQASTPDMRNKSARQLESLAQTLFSLSTSVASAEDSSSSNLKLSISPQSAFRMQCLAFRTRVIWWQLAGHQLNADKELWAPLAKCVAAFCRRTKMAPDLNYELVSTALEELETALKDCLSSLHLPLSLREPVASQKAIYRSMSQLAQAAKFTNEAMKWTTKFQSSGGSSSSPGAETAICTVRLAALGIHSENGEHLLETAVRCLSGNLKGDTSNLDNLLVEVTGLRKAVMKVLGEEIGNLKPNVLSSTSRLCCDAIFGCLRFLVRYLGQSPPPDSGLASVNRYRERVVLTEKVSRAFLESVMLCAKTRIQVDDLDFESLDDILRICCQLLSDLQDASPGDDDNAYASQNSQHFPLVNISNLYWALYMKQVKAQGSFKNAGLLSLRRSVEVLRGRTTIEKEKASLSIKLDRLAEFFFRIGQPKDSLYTVEEAIREHVETGVLRLAANLSTTKCLSEISASNNSIPLLIKIVQQHEHLCTKYVSDDGHNGFFDNSELLLEERGLLLEWQLSFMAQTLRKSRQVNQELKRRFQKVTDLLLEIYDKDDYPVRRLRVAKTVSFLEAEHPGLLGDLIVQQLQACLKPSKSLSSKDHGLEKYRKSLSATLRVSIALEKNPADVALLEKSIIEWQAVLDTCTSLALLVDSIDDVNACLTLISLLVDYLDMQGLFRLQIPALHLLTKIHELHPDTELSDILQTHCRLALVYLRTGNSGKAGLLLAKTEPLTSQQGVGTEAVLRWYLAYAEYSLAIGSIEKCGKTLNDAERFAKEASDLAGLAESSNSIASRIKLTRLLADASYISSQFELESGRADEAFRFARNCVKLNQKSWVYLESRLPPSPPPTPVETDASMDHLALSMAGLSTSKSPIVASMTQDALRGPAFWSLVPSLLRGLKNLSQIFAHYGLLHESVHYAEQAKTIADTVQSPSAICSAAISVANLWTRGGKVEDAQVHMDRAAEISKQLQMRPEQVTLKIIEGRMWRARGELEEEAECYDKALEIVDQLSSSGFLDALDCAGTRRDELVENLAKLTLNTKPAKSARVKKAPIKAPPKVLKRGNTAKAPTTLSNTSLDYTPLTKQRNRILRFKALTSLGQKNIQLDAEAISEADHLDTSPQDIVEHAILQFRLLFNEASKQMASNLTFSALIESTIALPALTQPERRPSYSIDRQSILAPKTSRPAAKTSKKAAPGKESAAKAVPAKDFALTLHTARDGLAQIQYNSVQVSSASTMQELGRLLGSSAVLLSAATHIHPKAVAHPLLVAYWLGQYRPPPTAPNLAKLTVSRLAKHTHFSPDPVPVANRKRNFTQGQAAPVARCRRKSFCQASYTHMEPIPGGLH
jgi:separase